MNINGYSWSLFIKKQLNLQNLTFNPFEKMTHKVLILGRHPLLNNIQHQYQSLGYDVDCQSDISGFSNIQEYEEFFILPNGNDSDSKTLHIVEILANSYKPTQNKPVHPICHVMLQSNMSLWLLQTLDIYEEINQKFELTPFTLEDQWAKTILCHLPGNTMYYPPLDREQIDTMSNKTIHFLLLGFNSLGENLALHTALIAHYPNFVRDHTLKTRITIVDNNIQTKRDAFIQRYQSLFNHSYYRFIDLNKKQQTYFHAPLYYGTREDFVDVEWEFVEGDFHHPSMQNKLKSWAECKKQILTIALCLNEQKKNFDEAFVLPSEIYQEGIPVFVHVKESEMIDKIRNKEGYNNIYPIGMDGYGYDVRQPLQQMAKRLNYFYKCSYSQKGVPTNIPLEEMEKEWNAIKSFNIRYSNIYNVMTIATKMRSLGHKEEDWKQFYALTREEIEQISAVEHNRWNVERLILGFRPPTDTEREEITENIKEHITAKKKGTAPPKKYLKKDYKQKKVHYDLCAYQELKEDDTGQNVRIYDFDLTACIPLIANSFFENSI